MKRTIKMLVYGGLFSFGLLLAAAVIFSGIVWNAAAAPAEPVAPVTPEANAVPEYIQRQAELQAQLAQLNTLAAEREAAYQERISAGLKMVQDQESTYQEEINKVQEQINSEREVLNQAVLEREAAKAKLAKAQQAVKNADYSFKKEMETKTAEQAQKESQLQGQTQQTVDQLKAAYDQIAQGQTAPAESSSGGGGGGGGGGGDSHSHDDHESEHGDEHDD
jgi:putative cell wall-binding protein